MASKVGEVFVELKLKGAKAAKDLSKFKQNTKDAGQAADKTKAKTKQLGRTLKRTGQLAAQAGGRIKQGMKVAGVALAGGVIAAFLFAKAWSASTDELQKAAQQVDSTANELQKLAFAADLAGESGDAVRNSIKQFARLSVDAREKGVTPFSTALFQLGLSLDELDDKTFTEKMGLIGDRLNLIEDDSTRTSLKLRIFGRDGQKIGNTLAGGAKGIKAATDEVERLGATLSKEALKASADFNDESARLAITLTGVKNVIAEELVPAVTRGITVSRKWLLANRDLIAVKLKAFLLGAVKVLETIVPLIQKAADNVVKFVNSLGGFENSLRTVIGVLGAFKIAAAGAFGAAAPWLAGILLAVTAIDALISSMQAARDEARKFAKEKTVTDIEKFGGAFTEDVNLIKTERGRTILALKRQRAIFEAEQKETLKQIQEFEAKDAGQPLALKGEGVAQRRRKEAGFQERVATAERQIESFNRIIQDQFIELKKEQRKAGVERTRREKIATEAGAGRGSVATIEQIKEFQRLGILFTRGKATQGQETRLRQLAKITNLPIPPAKVKDPFADPTGAGAGAGERTREKTPLELVNELTRSGAGAAITNLQPTGPGTVVNHNNFSVNLESDIDIILNGGRELPRDGTMREVAAMLKESAVDAVHEVVNQAFQVQRRQVIG